MATKTLRARSRSDLGKGAAARYRREGLLPAVVYGRHGTARPILLTQRDFDKLFREITESTILTLSFEDEAGESIDAFVKDYQYQIIDDSIYHVDFYEVESGQLLRARVQVVFEGSPEGVRLGAVLETGVTEIEVECYPKDLPERVVLDISELELNESLHVRDLDFAEEVRVLTDEDLAVVVLKMVRIEEETEEEEGEASEEAGEETEAEEHSTE